MFTKLFDRRGYTIDQTILIVAIIAILITLIIVTIGWQLINRTSATKLAAQLRQMEDAIATFYSSQRLWPHQALAGSPSKLGYALALAGVGTGGGASGWASTVTVADIRNQLPGFRINGTTDLQHPLGSGGTVGMVNGTAAAWDLGSTTTYELVEFANIPYDQAVEADRTIDGVASTGAVGRLVYDDTTCLPSAGGAAPTPTPPTSGNVFVCYAANVVN